MAEFVDPGIPNPNIGTIEPPTAALLALSTATIPSSAPFPKRSGCLETRFASP